MPILSLSGFSKQLLAITLLYFLICLPLTTSAQVPAPTLFERSGATKTPTYKEGIDYLEKLANGFPALQLDTLGSTDSGLPLHLLTLDVSRSFDFKEAHRNGKVVILVNNGIHPGEPDGIDACMMLFRDIMQSRKKQKHLDNIVLAMIPYYNVGGALQRNQYTRTNQNGPVAYGFRGNARNLDLNRDFIKADSRNALSFAKIFHHVQPDIFIDTHTSNGADYQYRITHIATQHNKLGGELGRYMDQEMTPALEKLMAEKKEPITPYVNVFNKSPENGFTQFMDHPRYSTGYAALFHSLGFMIETHMLKPYKARVGATYKFLEVILEIAKVDGEKIKNIRQRALATSIKPGNYYPIRWKNDTSQSAQRSFLGYTALYKESQITGQNRLYFDHKRPYEKRIPFYNTYVPTDSVKIPVAYVIPQGWHRVINRLKANQVALQRLAKDTTLETSGYRIVSVKTASRAYEGHFPHRNTEVEPTRDKVKFRAGDFIAYTSQPTGRYLIEVLEPRARDSFFSWNFFDTILQQKEHFSPYVFEDIAPAILANNPTLKKTFETKKANDKAFAQNWYAQLDFIYKNSKHYEPPHKQYPIYRIYP